MTLVDALQVAEGVVKKNTDAYNRGVLSSRALASYVNNSFSKSPKTYDEVWALAKTEDEDEEQEVKGKKWTLPAKYLMSILSGTVKQE